MTNSLSTSLRLLGRDRWTVEAGRFADRSYRQHWQFNVDCAARLGASTEHVAIECEGRLLGLSGVRCKRVPFLGTGVAYVNGGPLTQLDGLSSPAALSACLQALVSEYALRRGMLLRIAPPLGDPAWNESITEVFLQSGFRAANHAVARRYRTLVVDIRDPLPSIRARLAQKWRNCLNRAERNGLELRCSDDDALFATFVDLYGELIERKRFTVDLDAGFYRRVQQQAAPGERLHLAIALFDGRPAAGIVASLTGRTAVYLLGAANAVGMQQKAAYLLQWHVIEQARVRGCRWYDLGGIDPEENPGVYHFKQGLGGIEITAPGPFEFRPGGLRSRLVSAAERAYRWFRKRNLGPAVRRPDTAPTIETAGGLAEK